MVIFNSYVKLPEGIYCECRIGGAEGRLWGDAEKLALRRAPRNSRKPSKNSWNSSDRISSVNE